MLYLASGYEERVGEGFENRVTRWNPRKDVRVHKVHVRASCSTRMDVHGHGHVQEGTQCAVGSVGGRGKDIGAQSGMRAGVSTDVHVHASQGDARDVRAWERAREHGRRRMCAARHAWVREQGCWSARLCSGTIHPRAQSSPEIT
ncbi:hypothetical protein CDL15_Pgr009179 [Punica granatum]|uniref:Uncharacterized protein n=1 Tax=Punica granatum TaxID=22663 RepID=A0A218WUV7_PUNGR|nr:hypothetical protein CDL15_Pgr009179 [Punica granatum]PKI47622.1 hypothetical protein CRG98_031973 [Punica granatum]